eukprot:CAMPEP_0197605932 /NCGR_PEP_ID=MMETSP1326-20131121/44052_1 /TAXON_ID=1155430 /ORGANISM="Genus nov. species nov., Strain RCC2288" /LENGTH=72 /DNA_ID=CAMNT_0043173783 /DNA_START=13 /DNA_END=228 /DNA_ORIENTATION=+
MAAYPRSRQLRLMMPTTRPVGTAPSRPVVVRGPLPLLLGATSSATCGASDTPSAAAPAVMMFLSSSSSSSSS